MSREVLIDKSDIHVNGSLATQPIHMLDFPWFVAAHVLTCEYLQVKGKGKVSLAVEADGTTMCKSGRNLVMSLAHS